MPTTAYESLLDNLVEALDPPVPTRSNSLAKPSGPVRQKHITQCVLLALFFAAPAGAFFYYSHWILGGIFGLLSILMVVAAFSSNLWVAACPYCSAIFKPTAGLKPDAEGKTFQCEECWEYSIIQGGRLKAHDAKAISDVPLFRSPVYKEGVWPKGCVACGAPPTRLEEIKARSVSYGMLALGRLWVSSGKASGIPYCESHKDAVGLKLDQQKRLWLEWCSLQMMRRYVAANRKLGKARVKKFL